MDFHEIPKKLRLSPLVIWYFLLKLYLFQKGSINLGIPYNLLFLAYCVIPFPEAIVRNRFFRFANPVTVLVLALLLLWHDSWLPPIIEGGAFLSQQGIPSLSYIISFTGGFFSMSIVAISLFLLLFSFVVCRFRTAMITAIAILIILVPLVPTKATRALEPQVQIVEAAESNPAKRLEAFYSSESERVIIYNKPSASSVPFDIVFLHVCSLSWDDLKQIGISKDDPFFKQFDYLFTNFNSATGYSGPAVSRLLQASCGQRSHIDVHKKNTNKACLMFEGLESAGYENYVVMSHDGKYGDYNKLIKSNGLDSAVLMLPEKIAPSAIFFDSTTPLYSDYTMMKKWLDTRQGKKTERAALYYNSVLLHAGSHWVGEKSWASRDKQDQFKEVSTVLLKDVKKFIDSLKNSKRNTILVFIPEHGRALTGSPFQPPDMRDIPLPKITLVPVGIKLIGPKFNNAKTEQHLITKPSSYFALSWLMSKFIENSPFGKSPMSSEDIVFKIPKTDFVSEHEWNRIIEMDGKYFYSGKDKKWKELTQNQLK